MNYLIVVPRIVSKVGDYYMFPLGIAYISSALTNAGFNVYKLNLNHIDLPVESALKNEIISNNIDVVLTGGLTPQYGAVRIILDSVKKINDKILTIVGGGIITSAPVFGMQALECADYGVIGEGEYIVCELCRSLEEKSDIKKIPGVVYKENGNYVVTDGKPKPVDVNGIPYPDYKGLSLDEMLETMPDLVGMNETNTFPIITSRGCPYRCSFCFRPSGQKYRQRKFDDVFNEIDYLTGEFDIKHLFVMDDNFGHNIERVRDFCRRIKTYNIKWGADFRVTDITQELLSMLKDANCIRINFGVESADDRVLKSMNKRITIEEINKALELVHNAGIFISGLLIFGDIAETKETATNTFNWWKDHLRYGIHLNLIYTYPGTAIFNYAYKEGLIKDPIQFIRDACPVIKLSKMGKEEYEWMVEQIIKLERTEQNLPLEVKYLKIDFEQAYMDLVGVCTLCKSINKWDKIRLLHTQGDLYCKNCGKRHDGPIPIAVAERLAEQILLLIKKYNRVCFWGVNSYFNELCQKMALPYKENIFIVDKSEIRHGVNISGRKVQPTEIIKERNINCIIVTVPQYFASITSSIEKEFPHVDRVINIVDLLSEHFV